LDFAHLMALPDYAALWLWDAVPGFLDCLQQKIARDATVRLCLGDPDSEAVMLRGQEEGIEGALAGRCRLAATYARPIHEADGNAVRLSDGTLYASMLRFDDDVLLNTHLWGSPAGDSPVLHFRRQGDHGIAAHAIRSFERIWAAAQPLSGR
jgi:hypothetical protein